jgi:hypothetical protein
MATRATYTINEHEKGEFHFYIHWDGYPEGAANYFRQMLLAMEDAKNRGGFIENFIRANHLAELTEGRDAHGDTEFHYNLSILSDGSTHLFAYSRVNEEFRSFWNGNLTSFVRTNGGIHGNA